MDRASAHLIFFLLSLIAVAADRYNYLSQDEKDRKLLHASLHGHTEIALALLAAGANKDVKNNDGWTALMMACYKGRLNVMKALLLAGANKDTKEPEHGFTALALGIQVSNYYVVEALLDEGANKDATDKYGNTPLIRASQLHPEYVNIMVIQKLLDAGANKDAKNKAGKTARDVAEEYFNLDIVRIL